MEMGWPANLTWYKLFMDWGSLFGGGAAFIAGIIAFCAGQKQATATRQAAKIQIEAERSKGKQELESLRRALGVEVRMYTANALTAHCYLTSLIWAKDNKRPQHSGVHSYLIEDRAKLPAANIYANAGSKIGEFGDCAGTLVRFFMSVAVVREAADRLRCFPQADNVPPSKIAEAANGLIDIAKMGSELFPILKTGIESLDSTDSDGFKKIEQAYRHWRSCREQFYPFHS